MKNKGKPRSVVELSIILALALLLLLGACGRKNQSVKLEDAGDLIQGLENAAPSGPLPSAFRDDVYYEVTSINWNGASGVAEVRVETPDLERIIYDAIQAAIKERGTEDYDALLENVRERIQEVLSSKNYPTMQSTVQMDAEKTGDSYTLFSNEEFERVISGNLEEIFLRVLMEGFSYEKK